jgi:hypothetical protein
MLTIPQEEWIKHRVTLERFYTESFDPDTVHVIIICSMDTEVSFLYNPEKNNISGFEIKNLLLNKIYNR